MQKKGWLFLVEAVKMTLRDKILNVEDIKKEEVDVRDWGVKIEVRGLTGQARGALLNTCMDKFGNMDLEKMYPEVIIACSYDLETGQKIFTPADKDAINGKSGAALEQIASVALRLSGMGPNALEQQIKN